MNNIEQTFPNINQISEKIKECIITNNPETLKKLIDQFNFLYQPIDANNLSILHYAVQNGKKNIVEELSSMMFEKNGINVKDNFGRTPLHSAAAKGDIPIIKTLILCSGDVNSMTISGETPLMKSIAFYQPKAANILLRFGANPFLKNNVTQKNCLAQAKQTKNIELINIVDKYKIVYEKIALLLLVYMSLGNTDRKSIFNNIPITLLKKLIKYIIP
jgi:hypothetical protein